MPQQALDILIILQDEDLNPLIIGFQMALFCIFKSFGYMMLTEKFPAHFFTKLTD